MNDEWLLLSRRANGLIMQLLTVPHAPPPTTTTSIQDNWINSEPALIASLLEGIWHATLATDDA